MRITSLHRSIRRPAALAAATGLITAALLTGAAPGAQAATGPDPKAACAYYNGTALTTYGQRNDRVKQVQCLLANRKYLPWSSLTGYFGDKTLAAVKKFQKAAHLPADGKVGKKTWKALYA
ncbi:MULTISPECIES: peptidoglycan-binding domain-containing protein [Streptomyces]|uniref:Peptidoglycan-binding domain-containing protein n=1 Tax=Streptomyces ramulosus TaxID=47762 RepID=A0ABW1FPU2_9ACTN